jgi:hypothetical protein
MKIGTVFVFLSMQYAALTNRSSLLFVTIVTSDCRSQTTFTAIFSAKKGHRTCRVHCKERMPKIWSKCSQKRNIAVWVPVSTFMCLWAMGLPFLLEEICGLMLGIYKSLTDTWMWKLGLRPRNSQERNTETEFPLQCTDSISIVLLYCSCRLYLWYEALLRKTGSSPTLPDWCRYSPSVHTVEGLSCKRPIQCLLSSEILTPHPRLWCGGRTHSLGEEGVRGSIVRKVLLQNVASRNVNVT